MSIKRKVKDVIIAAIGMDRVLYLFSKYKYIKTKKYSGKSCIQGKHITANPVTENWLIKDEMIGAQEKKVKVYEIKGRHVFFGYFDLAQIDKKEEKMLVISVDKKAKTDKDVAYIGYFDLKNDKNEYVELAATRAWCWQQGARLRFHPYRDNVILFNDVENGKYVCREFDIANRQVLKTYSEALYDIDSEMKYGIGLNFSRLQRLRPGYGYDKLEDNTKGIKAPENDGIYRVNLETGEKTLMVSYKELAKTNDRDEKYEHYVNHLSISPDGKKFIFFHIYAIEGYTKWKTGLYVMDISGENMKLLEDSHNVSHYCWKNNDEVLITLVEPGKKQYYAMYNVNTGEKNIIGGNVLTRDGHPWILEDRKSFISDTYPDGHSVQHLFRYDMQSGKKEEIAALYSDPRLYMEKRCDLHPRVSASERIVTVDSTFSHKCRKVLLMELIGDQENKNV